MRSDKKNGEMFIPLLVRYFGKSFVLGILKLSVFKRTVNEFSSDIPATRLSELIRKITCYQQVRFSASFYLY
jgi:hypothetical protein